MRKTSLAGLLGLLWLAAAPVSAHDNGRWHRHEYEPDYRGEYRQEYRRDRLPITSVAEARRLADDSRIILSGRIVRRLDDDEFLFRDGTGTIRIEMDKDDWRRLRRHRRGRILIWAEVDRDKRRVELEVERVRPAYR
ncbi:NirD/YgiW/YdeI family stress tolerance protein [Oceanimonas sp. CHS3-5]|uniref:YgiW/YdeI family stress tolerance OB fold protein n=1 Tax=Oceanimonas sp. CHS3-5 TaxID=3068186 RepID=UPI00273E9BA0|nr:NirD/YgiW/YdeI family stress tolerance protein [Oceanimonas sp. CHS3-5]MDP5291684.1 NirD/YgiW/YdeI family stress tolerance protein [Oceanimonas sp. CHS3-5]